jgi:hypothetical protein
MKPIMRSWRRRKDSQAGDVGDAGEASSDGSGDELTRRNDAEALHARVREDLAAVGVSGEHTERIAEKIAERLLERGPEGYEELLAGVRFGCTCAAQADAGDPQRLERLVNGFATELSKLDETLEVLTTYLRRMRMDASGEPKDTVH